jgi:hypothetical protein
MTNLLRSPLLNLNQPASVKPRESQFQGSGIRHRPRQAISNGLRRLRPTSYTSRRKYRHSTPVLAGLDPAIGYPQPIANDAIPISNHPKKMTGLILGSSPRTVMTGSDRCVRYVNSKGSCYHAVVVMPVR